MTTLTFLRKDVETQIDAAKELLELVRAVRTSATGIQGPEREQLEDIAKKLVVVTERLVKNARDTGKTVSDLVRTAS